MYVCVASRTRRSSFANNAHVQWKEVGEQFGKTYIHRMIHSISNNGKNKRCEDSYTPNEIFQTDQVCS